jgi:hypothetical protein
MKQDVKLYLRTCDSRKLTRLIVNLVPAPVQKTLNGDSWRLRDLFPDSFLGGHSAAESTSSSAHHNRSLPQIFKTSHTSGKDVAVVASETAVGTIMMSITDSITSRSTTNSCISTPKERQMEHLAKSQHIQ